MTWPLASYRENVHHWLAPSGSRFTYSIVYPAKLLYTVIVELSGSVCTALVVQAL